MTTKTAIQIVLGKIKSKTLTISSNAVQINGTSLFFSYRNENGFYTITASNIAAITQYVSTDATDFQKELKSVIETH